MSFKACSSANINFSFEVLWMVEVSGRVAQFG